jgi:hypothetical protein
MSDELLPSQDDQRLWTLLGAVELTYHPALAAGLLLGVEAVVSPVPAVLFDPLSITVTGRGLPITTLLAVVVLVDLASDVVGVSGTGWTGEWGGGDE